MNKKFTRYALIWFLLIATIYVADGFVRDIFLTGDQPRSITPRGSLTELEKSTVTLFKETAPSVVYIFTKGNKILLIKNTKFNFLKNLKIFPMEEISRPKSLKKSLNFKMSNMNMNINIKVMRGMNNIENSSWIEQTKFNSYTLPTFTKKIFSSLGKYL